MTRASSSSFNAQAADDAAVAGAVELYTGMEAFVGALQRKPLVISSLHSVLAYLLIEPETETPLDEALLRIISALRQKFPAKFTEKVSNEYKVIKSISLLPKSSKWFKEENIAAVLVIMQEIVSIIEKTPLLQRILAEFLAVLAQFALAFPDRYKTEEKALTLAQQAILSSLPRILPDKLAWFKPWFKKENMLALLVIWQELSASLAGEPEAEKGIMDWLLEMFAQYLVDPLSGQELVTEEKWVDALAVVVADFSGELRENPLVSSPSLRDMLAYLLDPSSTDSLAAKLLTIVNRFPEKYKEENRAQEKRLSLMQYGRLAALSRVLSNYSEQEVSELLASMLGEGGLVIDWLVTEVESRLITALLPTQDNIDQCEASSMSVAEEAPEFSEWPEAWREQLRGCQEKMLWCYYITSELGKIHDASKNDNRKAMLTTWLQKVKDYAGQYDTCYQLAYEQMREVLLQGRRGENSAAIEEVSNLFEKSIEGINDSFCTMMEDNLKQIKKKSFGGDDAKEHIDFLEALWNLVKTVFKNSSYAKVKSRVHGPCCMALFKSNKPVPETIRKGIPIPVF